MNNNHHGPGTATSYIPSKLYDTTTIAPSRAVAKAHLVALFLPFHACMFGVVPGVGQAVFWSLGSLVEEDEERGDVRGKRSPVLRTLGKTRCGCRVYIGVR